jgi:hypothetical protein
MLENLNIFKNFAKVKTHFLANFFQSQFESPSVH